MKGTLVGILIGISAIVFFQSPFQAQEQPKIHERVEVVNMEVLVRALNKDGLPVAGLKKEDFRIEEGRVPVEINGFAEIRKKIAVAGPAHRRLFALFFNVGNPRPDLDKAVDMFFETIFRPGDRLMVMTNRFSIADHVVIDPAQERETIKGILLGETRNFRFRLVQLEQKLKPLAVDLKNSFHSDREAALLSRDMKIPSSGGPSGIELYSRLRRFYMEYLLDFEEYRRGYLSLTLEQYARMAEYLKNQEVEKYALVFYQQGIYPQIPEQGHLQIAIDKALPYDSLQGMKTAQLFADVQTQLMAPKGPSKTDIARLFLNSGVTFHTLLLLPSVRREMEDLEYQPVAAGPENVLVKLAELTNGVLASYVKYGDFFRQVERQEDVYYQLTYAPADGNKEREVNVGVVGKKLNLVYDNRRQPQYICDLVEKEQTVPQVQIKDLGVNGLWMGVTVAGFGREDLRRKEPLAERAEGKKRIGKIQLRRRVWDGDGQEVFDQADEFLSDAEQMQKVLPLPVDLSPGTYDLIVEALDLNTGRTDLAIRGVAVNEAGEYRQVEAPKGLGGGSGGESGCLERTGKERDECFNQLAESYLAWGDIAAAERYYEQSGEENRIAGLNRIGDSFHDKGENERALVYYEKGAPTINRVRASTVLADRYGRKGKKVLALHYFRNAVTDFEALALSGNAFLDDADWKENERCLREIVRLERRPK